MRHVTPFLLTLFWSLWFGGIVAILVAVQAIFGAFPQAERAVAGRAASNVFQYFGLYELGVAAGALVVAAAIRLRRASAARTAVFVLLALAGAMAAVTSGVVTPRIESLRQAGESQSAEFKRLHGASMALFTGRGLLLLVAGTMLPIVTRREAAEVRA